MRRSRGGERIAPRRVAALAAIVAGMAVFGPALHREAHAHDPAIPWRTLFSPHFRVHHPERLYRDAVDVARSAEAGLAELTARLGWMPQTPIDIVVSDEMDSPSGFAVSVPRNLIGVGAATATEVSELSHYADWYHTLVVHELAHIVHMDTIHGLPQILNSVFGRWLAPNATQPRWLVEGLAVYFESALTGHGRNHSTYFDMLMRVAVLEGAFLDLGEITGVPWKWPQGSIPYLYGGRFLEYLVKRFGEQVLTDVSHDYAGRLIPFAVNLSLQRATGHGYPELYQDFVGELRERYQAMRDAVVQAGRLEGVALTDRGQRIGRVSEGDDGTLYFVESPLGSHTVLQALSPQSGAQRTVARVYSGAEVTVAPGGGFALLSQAEMHGVYRMYEDLFRVDLQTGEQSRLTFGARIATPELCRDGTHVVFVRSTGRHEVLQWGRLDALGSATTVADLGLDSQIWSPRCSPDGRWAVFAAAAGGRRDLYRVELDSRRVTRLTSDESTDGGPALTPDGQWVLFHSDRSGIFDIYAMPAAGGPVRRVTRVVGGAFHPQPSRDGERLYYRSYGSRGFDLAVLPLADVGGLPLAEPMPIAENTRVPAPASLEAYPEDDYDPLWTLTPNAWMPIVGADIRGTLIGAAVSGQDAVGRHGYAAQAWWGLQSRFPGLGLLYANSAFHPGLQASLSRHLSVAAIPYGCGDVYMPVEEEVWRGSLSVPWPLWQRREARAFATAGYDMTLRRNTRPFESCGDASPPTFPDQGRFATTRLSIGITNAQAYLGSISQEEGGSLQLSVRAEHPWLGSSYRAVASTLSGSYYLRNPWLRRHVLAVDAFAGYGRSNYGHRRLFSIGGLPTRDPLLDLITGRLSVTPALRGFPAIALSGNSIVSAHAEYRLPLVDLERGHDTLPVYWRALHAALFVDTALIATKPRRLPGSRRSTVGAELRLGMLFGYAIPVTIRAGYGRGLGRDRHRQRFFLVMGQVF